MKIIHYCWFGGAIPPDVETRVRRWRLLHPTWSIQQWNNTNVSLDQCSYARAAATTRSWAYLSDYVRLHVLHEEGGVYLDTDVELLQPLDPLVDEALHVGYMHNCALGTALIISPARHALIRELLTFYEQLNGDRMLNNNAVFTEYFLQEVPDFKLDGRSWQKHGISVHPKTFFEQPDLRRRGYAVHLYNRSWDNPTAKKLSQHRMEPGMLFVLKRTLRSLLEEARCFYLRHFLRDRWHLPLKVPTLPLSFCGPVTRPAHGTQSDESSN